jgi:hypothetical protein
VGKQDAAVTLLRLGADSNAAIAMHRLDELRMLGINLVSFLLSREICASIVRS